MVMCAMESMVSIPRPPPLSAFLKQTGGCCGGGGGDSETPRRGFRLLDNQDDTGSVYSVYKQKIDAMFESDASSTTKNSVQARIEKMFTDVAIDNGIPVNPYGCHHFSVDYLGSVPLQEKVTSLAGLQKPLWDLYFAYKRTTKHKKTLTGRLEISASGLKVQYQGEKGDLEQLNSFPTIAVWSAVKFVVHEGATCAFLPLITDPDNIDKQQLFRSMDHTERKMIGVTETHSPLFAVVMRKIGVHKQLECHGFVCQTSEDAIVIAATLYKSLMSHMKAKEKKPRNRNGVTCMSVTSSAFNDSGSAPVRPPRKKRSSASSATSDIDTVDTETAPLIQQSSHPPRKSVKTKKAPKAPEKKVEDLDAITPYEEPKQDAAKEPAKLPLGDKWNTYKSNTQKQITAEIKQVMSADSNMGLKRLKSLRKRDGDELKTNSTGNTGENNGGDILTKVTIPRSGSFLNAGGLTRYKSKVQRLNGQATGGSPLGFHELFNEFRLQEGLHSMDEILGVIIDPEGMSFNDLKPIYKEFLLKLAVTLTKDELYQRSKSIMRRHKKKLLRKNSVAAHPKKRSVVVCSKLKRLKHVFQKFHKHKVKDQSDEKIVDESKVPESTISSTSYDTRHFTPKVPVTRKQSHRKKDRHSTSEESDFFSLRKARSKSTSNNHNRNSSSGYVSCSECSFDSDTCTCVSADKCYCSLGHRHYQDYQRKCCCGYLNDDSLTWCGCDTDSCADSNKCYCNTAPVDKGATIFEQLKRRGFIPTSESACSPPASRRLLCKKNSNTKSTKSLEYMHNPSEKYYEKLRPKKGVEYVPVYTKSVCESGLRPRGPRTIQSAALPPDSCSEALSVKKTAEIAALFADIKLSQTTDITQIMPRHQGRMISNSLYASKHHPNPKGSLYSAKNGLYTIQSQSDDSKSDRDYFNVKSKVAGGALENSLGYLP